MTLAAKKLELGEQEDVFLTTIVAPMSFDVSLTRNILQGATTNVPWSVIWHSPDGFEWGYGGSGPADLALNIINAFVPPGSDGFDSQPCHVGSASYTAVVLHQDFKNDFLCDIDKEGGTIKATDIRGWIERNRPMETNNE